MIIPVNKPAGYTSHDIVAEIRHADGKKMKIGHTGTLDPMCTGVLPVLTGKYTKLSDFFPSDKAYTCTILLGTMTDTQDLTGEIIGKKDVNISEEKLIDALNSFVGQTEQIPPMYSSIKKNGVPLYRLARQGKSVEREPRLINISEIKYNGIVGENSYSFTVFCSAGTYIRTLCEDIGNLLGCGACMSSLHRIRSNGISIDSCYDFHDVLILAENGMLSTIGISCENAFSYLEKIIIPSNGERFYINGGEIDSSRIKNMNLIANTTYLAYSEEGRFLGIASSDENSTIKSSWNEDN